MNFFQTLWQRLDMLGRVGLLLGVLVIVSATLALGAYTLRTDYQVLFADLGPQDAATMVAELERLKTPYRLSGDGNTILVPAELVYKTRLKLVGKELPLRGAIGFELFNDSEVGMTEFAQKVNYQRALQGELTRTILALDEVQAVRVHLVLPEQVLFKKTGAHAKASISITAKPGKTLGVNEVQGIQRLVGAAVPDIKPDDVTIVDQHGIALTRRASIDGDTVMSSAALEDKRAIETYLNKKIAEVLDRALGSGQGMASVDVTLNLDQTKVTTENVLPANTSRAGGAAGVITHEKQTARDGNTDTDPARSTAATNNNGWSSREVDYQSGRRVEQVVSAAGAVSHLNVAVVVLQKLEQVPLDRLKDVIAATAGINRARGDTLAVYCVDQATGTRSSAATTLDPATTDAYKATPVPTEPAAVSLIAPAKPSLDMKWLVFASAALMVLLVIAARSGRNSPARAHKLSELERQRALAQVHRWLNSAPDQQKPGGNSIEEQD